MKINHAKWLFIGLFSITGIGLTSFYVATLYQELEQVRTELQESEDHAESLQTMLDDRDETITQKDEELSDKAASLAAKEAELNTKTQELEDSKAELDRQKQQAQALIATADGLKTDLRTVSECFGGITLALISTSQAEAYTYLQAVQNQCENAAEIVEDL